ncbi:MAG: NUDIX hydrolase [Rhodoferax sp.]
MRWLRRSGLALQERCVDHRILCEGHFLRVYRDTVVLPSGGCASREYVCHPGAVVVVPLLFDASGNINLVLESQYRHPLGQVIFEFPAGKLDPGEDPKSCAQRELLEETGFQANQWAQAGVIHPTVAYSTEVIEIWFAKDLVPGAQRLDDGELLDVLSIPADTFFDACRDGRITDAKTLCAGLWLQNWLSGAWLLSWSGS